MISHSTKGAFQPEELRALQATFDYITSQSWFPNSVEIQSSLARFLINRFPAEGLDPQKTKQFAENLAQQFQAHRVTEDISGFGNTVMAALPYLRAQARCYMMDGGAADRLVERTLKEAIKRIHSKPRDQNLLDWLRQLLSECRDRHGASVSN
ncbi:hypothetical protein [Shinella oryzae]|uniref:Uncharacterized protein n=1 Tax=Shinella oryzae TaxID=2871820 RepID=A0ABY9K3F3_9HYPH|nr:hypothetical protein [Shinella oryzae]WLS03118.1 hypothetical protein Q9315_00275 [Shinella oryzae]